MSIKRMIGIGVMLIGVVAILYSLYASGRIAEARRGIKSATGSMQHDMAGQLIGGVLEKKVGEYDAIVAALMWGGIALVVVGGAVTIYCGKKRRK